MLTQTYTEQFHNENWSIIFGISILVSEACGLKLRSTLLGPQCKTHVDVLHWAVIQAIVAILLQSFSKLNLLYFFTSFSKEQIFQLTVASYLTTSCFHKKDWDALNRAHVKYPCMLVNYSYLHSYILMHTAILACMNLSYSCIPCSPAGVSTIGDVMPTDLCSAFDHFFHAVQKHNYTYINTWIVSP